MDDILASIRKILNEDEPPAGPIPVTEPEPLLLTPDMMITRPEGSFPAGAREPPLVSPEPVPLAELPAPASAAAAPEPEPTPMPDPTPENQSLIAPAAAAAAAAALGQLSRAVAQERATVVTRGGPTIEELVREEIRPVLKEWLDTHLPAIVERLVRQEIERVMSRQG
ncbi:DUF2497 domain-containing protein [Sabulicella glaciei]|uniref:DUF2497 domain-containing protein n=1 Tax=Sabulicella glaciei TaxID=2984948 RepID=A0ABT3NRC3_9PROT|nr:DUF2497 domain-containing protein [Roseococcus sp. MDT2-1-1]MCW8084710.1 DUF2497 domain-containing protein [Roseococcus sp. MDT2-1-1]